MKRYWVVYCYSGKGRKRRVSILGPVFESQEEAVAECEHRRAKGWDAQWVGLSDATEGGWIV